MTRFGTLLAFCCILTVIGCDSSDRRDASASRDSSSPRDSSSSSDSSSSRDSSRRHNKTGGDKQAAASRSPSPRQFEPCSQGLPHSGMWKSDPTLADVNGDGHMDIGALPRLGPGPQVWLGNGAGQWTDSSQGLPYERSCGGGLEFADVNGDKKMDLVVADHCQGVFVYLGDGAGHWSMVTKELHPPILKPDLASMYTGAEAVAVGDVNGDGFPDIVASSSDQAGINLWLGDGSGSQWRVNSTGLPQTEWANRVRLHDVNGDGTLDLLAGYSRGPRVWLNDRKEGWKPAFQGLPSPMVHGLYMHVVAGDINRDGKVDLVAANWIDGPEIYLQEADGSWKRCGNEFPELLGGAASLAVGDLNNDGNLDIVVGGRLADTGGMSRGVYAIFGDGTGRMTWPAPSGLPTTGLSAFGGIALADINNDNYLDVAAGTGLIVETVPGGPKEPSMPERVIVWCSKPNSR